MADCSDLFYSVQGSLVFALPEVLLSGVVPGNSVPGGQGSQMLLPGGWLRVIVQDLLDRPTQRSSHWITI